MKYHSHDCETCWNLKLQEGWVNVIFVDSRKNVLTEKLCFPAGQVRSCRQCVGARPLLTPVTAVFFVYVLWTLLTVSV